MKNETQWAKKPDGTWARTNGGGDDIIVGWDPASRHRAELEVSVEVRGWGNITVYIPKKVLDDLSGKGGA